MATPLSTRFCGVAFLLACFVSDRFDGIIGRISAMRIIAGTYRSRRLQTLKGLALRPSSDRLRETLFNVLGPGVRGAVFLDLFAGSGAVGIEALSRGAERAIFVENHRSGAGVIRRNLRTLGIPVSSASAILARSSFSGGAEIVVLDAAAALRQLSERGLRADFIFADPPYADSEAYDSVLDLVGDSEILVSDGQMVLEHDRRRVLPAVVGKLERTRVLDQGDNALSFYRPFNAA